MVKKTWSVPDFYSARNKHYVIEIHAFNQEGTRKNLTPFHFTFFPIVKRVKT